MTGAPGAKGTRHIFTDVELAWIGEHQTELRRSVSEQQFLYRSLGIGFVVGLAAHIVGYVLRSSATIELLGLVADLLYALGFALWTGVVVVVFVQIIPEAKQRQIKGALEAYEAARHDTAGAASDQASGGEARHPPES